MRPEPPRQAENLANELLKGNLSPDDIDVQKAAITAAMVLGLEGWMEDMVVPGEGLQAAHKKNPALILSAVREYRKLVQEERERQSGGINFSLNIGRVKPADE